MVNRHSLKKNKNIKKKQKGGSAEYEELLVKYNNDIGSLLPSLERKIHLCLDKKLCSPQSDWKDFWEIANNVVKKCNEIIDSITGDEESLTPEDLEDLRKDQSLMGKALSSVAPSGKFSKTKGGSLKKNKEKIKKGGAGLVEEGELEGENIFGEQQIPKDPTERIKRPAIRLSCMMLKRGLCKLFEKHGLPLNNCKI
jgi:hypothetical protein